MEEDTTPERRSFTSPAIVVPVIILTVAFVSFFVSSEAALVLMAVCFGVFAIYAVISSMGEERRRTSRRS